MRELAGDSPPPPPPRTCTEMINYVYATFSPKLVYFPVRTQYFFFTITWTLKQRSVYANNADGTKKDTLYKKLLDFTVPSRDVTVYGY